MLSLLALSGCADEEGAVARSGSSSTAASSASPTATVVGGRAGVPDEAKTHTRAGAESFIRYYFDMVNHAWKVPEPSALAGLGEETCHFCAAMTREAREMKTKGERYASNPLQVTAVGPLDGAGPDDEFFTMAISQPPVKIVDRSGAQVDTQRSSKYQAHIGVTWAHSQWSVIEVEDPDK